jgi:hypothetical protein
LLHSFDIRRLAAQQLILLGWGWVCLADFPVKRFNVPAAIGLLLTIAFGPRAGRKVLTLREAMPVGTDTEYERKPLCANEQGFSLHAVVRCHANERLKLECLCR